jgi:hypothetical protein
METMEKITTPIVGETLVAQWGYEASYPEFYKVIKVAGEYVTLQELKRIYMGPGSFYDARIMSTNGEASEEKPFRRKFKQNGDSFYVKINSYKYAYTWNGKPCVEYNHH